MQNTACSQRCCDAWVATGSLLNSQLGMHENACHSSVASRMNDTFRSALGSVLYMQQMPVQNVTFNEGLIRTWTSWHIPGLFSRARRTDGWTSAQHAYLVRQALLPAAAPPSTSEARQASLDSIQPDRSRWVLPPGTRHLLLPWLQPSPAGPSFPASATCLALAAPSPGFFWSSETSRRARTED
jgi:hypothetical protein